MAVDVVGLMDEMDTVDLGDLVDERIIEKTGAKMGKNWGFDGKN